MCNILCIDSDSIQKRRAKGSFCFFLQPELWDQLRDQISPNLVAQPTMPPESQAVLDAFKRFDSDMSGTISRDELAEAHTAIAGFSLSPAKTKA